MWACANAKGRQGGHECAALLLRHGASTEACEHTSRERRDALALASLRARSRRSVRGEASHERGHDAIEIFPVAAADAGDNLRRASHDVVVLVRQRREQRLQRRVAAVVAVAVAVAVVSLHDHPAEHPGGRAEQRAVPPQGFQSRAHARARADGAEQRARDALHVQTRAGARFGGELQRGHGRCQQRAGSLDGELADAVGVDAAPEAAFALVLRSDASSGFDVTLSRVRTGNLTVPSLGIVATAGRESAERAESDRDVNARCVHGGDEWRACLAMAAAAATRGDDGVETTTPQ